MHLNLLRLSPLLTCCSKITRHRTITATSGHISTDDTLSAFIWQFVVRARRLNSTSVSTFACSVDVRHCLDIPQTYPGLMHNMAYHMDSLQRLVEEPLGSVVSQLCSTLDPKTSSLNYNTRALATLLNHTPNKNVASFTATLDLLIDIIFSSWAKVDCYGHYLNLGLGEPEAVQGQRVRRRDCSCYLPTG